MESAETTEAFTVLNLDARLMSRHGVFANGPPQSGSLEKAAMITFSLNALLQTSVISRALTSTEGPIYNQLVTALQQNASLNGMPVHEIFLIVLKFVLYIH